MTLLCFTPRLMQRIILVHYKSMQCGVSFSQGSVSTIFSWGGYVFHICEKWKVSSSLQQCKIYFFLNLTSFSRVMITNVLPRFYVTQCSCYFLRSLSAGVICCWSSVLCWNISRLVAGHCRCWLVEGNCNLVIACHWPLWVGAQLY